MHKSTTNIIAHRINTKLLIYKGVGVADITARLFFFWEGGGGDKSGEDGGEAEWRETWHVRED